MISANIAEVEKEDRSVAVPGNSMSSLEMNLHQKKLLATF
jgi:hypothetical protein